MPRQQHLALLFCALIGGSVAFADGSSKERALTWDWQDVDLEWGSCPPFMPEGCALAVLHGDPAQEKADVFFKLPADSEIPSHWHTSAERMVLVSGELHVTYEGQEEVVMTPGSYAYGPPGLPHAGFCASGDPCVLFIAFNEPIDATPVEDSPD